MDKRLYFIQPKAPGTFDEALQKNKDFILINQDKVIKEGKFAEVSKYAEKHKEKKMSRTTNDLYEKGRIDAKIEHEINDIRSNISQVRTDLFYLACLFDDDKKYKEVEKDIEKLTHSFRKYTLKYLTKE